MLEIKNVSVSYGAVRALRDVSLRIDHGTVVTLIGANGAGKSTLLNAISGLVNYTGDITWKGDRLPKCPPEVVQRGIVQVPEGRQIFS
ncbi:MAG: ATP-binding cassette domain-containing protein, partial [Firmicutes bacterium]|nr:ATP-binding cassette domain-containing protein [Bacillota bacterium]